MNKIALVILVAVFVHAALVVETESQHGGYGGGFVKRIQFKEKV